MYITFLDTRRLSEDGFSVKCFQQGTTHDVAHTAACAALNKGWARKATDEEVEMANAATAELPGSVDAVGVLNNLFEDFNRIFSRPVLTNPATYAAKGEDL